MKQNISKQKSKLGGALGSLLVTAGIGAVMYYFTLPALNFHSEGFWTFLVVTSALFVMIYYIFTAGVSSLDSILELETNNRGVTVKKVSRRKKRRESGKTSGFLILIPMFFLAFPMVFGFISGSRFFHARAYSGILTVEEGDVDRIPSSDGTDSIALMDTASAEKLGDRKIGSLTSVVSQYDVSAYTQIDYKGKPVKTSPLRYAGFFKWAKNRGKGIPGYVIVDPVSMSADYKSLGSGMTYVPSAYFNENLRRHLRFSYPTKMFTNIHFEIDESGKPWYIAPTYEPTIGLFGGEQINGAVICDPVSGDSTWYPVGKIPRWTDVVFSGDLICEQYNNHAQLHEGFWNSIIGQTGCRKVTEYEGRDDDDYLADYGYVAKDGDIWIYTGVTSLNNDSSNIGFIMSNERTEETIFITCPGADEFSAMAAAQGEVQEKRYAASFPSLILVDGNPTYIMVMKDASGLVKMYAAVNVEQYNMVATATKQKECIDKYRALIGGEISQEEATGEGTVTNLKEETGAAAGETAAPDLSDAKEKTIKVKKMQTIDRGGNTWLYVVDTENRIYAAKYEDVLDMLLVEEGDEITIRTDGTYFAFEKK